MFIEMIRSTSPWVFGSPIKCAVVLPGTGGPNEIGFRDVNGSYCAIESKGGAVKAIFDVRETVRSVRAFRSDILPWSLVAFFYEYGHKEKIREAVSILLRRHTFCMGGWGLIGTDSGASIDSSAGNAEVRNITFCRMICVMYETFLFH